MFHPVHRRVTRAQTVRAKMNSIAFVKLANVSAFTKLAEPSKKSPEPHPKGNAAPVKVMEKTYELLPNSYI